MKKYRFPIIVILLIFGLNALFYFINKTIITDYHLIGWPIDDKIPAIWSFIWFYNIWYPFQIIVLFLLFKQDKKTFIRVTLALAISLIISHIIYFIYPTIVDRPLIETYDNITMWLVYITFLADTPPVNCLPSVHSLICFLVIFATISNKNLKLRWKYLIYFVNMMIVLATLFVRQHVLIDPIASLILAIGTYYILNRTKLFKRAEEKLAKYC